MHKKVINKDKQTVADAFAKYLWREISNSDSFHLALSGGSTPAVLFDHLALEYTDKINWSKVHLYWGDERCVPPDHPESNYRMAYEKFIRYVDIPASNIHRVKGENNPEAEAIRYSKEIEHHLRRQNKLPVFDCVLLGMGTDGHTASIFPHQMDLLQAPTTCAVATHPISGQQRITITGKVINAARQTHFLVTGASKKPILEHIFSNSDKAKNYPAFYIEKATWWLDDAAIL